MPSKISQPVLDLLAWLAAKPRTYAETMDAWRTSCPRLTVWEDALRGGLIQVGSGQTQREAPVMLTARGRQSLDDFMKHLGQAARIDQGA